MARVSSRAARGLAPRLARTRTCRESGTNENARRNPRSLDAPANETPARSLDVPSSFERLHRRAVGEPLSRAIRQEGRPAAQPGPPLRGGELRAEVPRVHCDLLEPRVRERPTAVRSAASRVAHDRREARSRLVGFGVLVRWSVDNPCPLMDSIQPDPTGHWYGTPDSCPAGQSRCAVTARPNARNGLWPPASARKR